MSFFTEPEGFTKTILSDLQGAWDVLRQEVVDSKELECAPKVIFLIDEATSWETVRNLKNMKPFLTLIRNIATQGHATDEIMLAIKDITEILNEVYQLKSNKEL